MTIRHSLAVAGAAGVGFVAAIAAVAFAAGMACSSSLVDRLDRG